MRVPLTVVSLVFAAALPLAAQNSVTGIRPLGFGIVFPGVPKVVPRTDATNSGQFNLQGRNNGLAFLQFTLPAVLNGPLGATMPVTFSTTDAGWSSTQSVGNQTAINPHVASLQRLSATGRASVFLGATTTPALGQRAGNYSASLTLSVTFF